MVQRCGGWGGDLEGGAAGRPCWGQESSPTCLRSSGDSSAERHQLGEHFMKNTQTPAGIALYEKHSDTNQLGESFMKNTETPVGRALYEKHSDTSWQSTL